MQFEDNRFEEAGEEQVRLWLRREPMSAEDVVKLSAARKWLNKKSQAREFQSENVYRLGKRQAQLAEASIQLSERQAQMAESANRLAIESNKLSKDSIRLSKWAIMLSGLGIVVAVIAIFK